MIGKLLIGRYLVLEQIGAGSFSKTFLTLDKYLPQSPLCVVKSLDIDADQDLSIEQVRPLFEREARILQHLRQKSDRVPQLLAYVEEDAQLYLVEEYIDGTAINQKLTQKQSLTPNEVIPILHEVLEILQIIHAQGLIYQDLKLNHLIRRQRDGKLVLIDFGAAIDIEERENIVFGTPGYSSIEQQNGCPTFSSDFYALGICAIQLLTGVPPDQLQRHPETGVLLWKSSLKLDPNFVEILDRLVAPKVCDRYSNAGEVLAALQSQVKRNNSTRALWKRWQNRLQFAGKGQKIFRPAPNWATTALFAVGAIILARQWFSTMPTNSAIAAQLATLKLADNSLTLLWERTIPPSAQPLLLTANQRIVIKDSHRSLQLRDIRSGKNLQSLQFSSLIAILLSQGKWLVGKNEENSVQAWNVETGRLVHTLPFRQPISNLILSSDKRTLTIANSTQIQVWNLETGKLAHAIAATDSEGIRTPLLHTPMNELVCATSQHRLQIIDSQTGAVKRVLAGHTSEIHQALLSPDQQFLYSFGSDRALVWNLNTGELVKAFPAQSAQVADAAITESHLVTLHTNGALRVWERETGNLQRTIDPPDGQNLLSADGRYLVNHGREQRLKVLQISFN